mgnify:CR=1 FL=1
MRRKSFLKHFIVFMYHFINWVYLGIKILYSIIRKQSEDKRVDNKVSAILWHFSTKRVCSYHFCCYSIYLKYNYCYRAIILIYLQLICPWGLLSKGGVLQESRISALHTVYWMPVNVDTWMVNETLHDFGVQYKALLILYI